jgi:hypothetical protein
MKKFFLPFFMICQSAISFSQSITITPDNYINTTATSNDNMKLVQYGNHLAGYELTFSKARGTAAAPTAIQSGDNLMFISGLGYDGTIFSETNFAITATSTENWTSTANGTQLRLSTTQNGTRATVPRFLIANDGKIAIGNHNPITRLHIRDGGASGVTPNSNPAVFIEDDRNTYLNLAAPDANETGVLFGRPDDTGTSGGIIYRSNKDMQLRTNGNATRMTVSSSGNVGIGITTPSAKLDINGDVIIRKKTVLPTTTQTVNDLERAGASVICTGAATSAQTITITGIGGGVDGMMLWVYPTQNFTIRLKDEDAGSVATNRIRTTTGTDDAVSSRGGATLIYDGTAQRWQVIDRN